MENVREIIKKISGWVAYIGSIINWIGNSLNTFPFPEKEDNEPSRAGKTGTT